MPNLPLGIPSDLDKYFFNRKKELIQLNTFISGFKQNVANQILITGRRVCWEILSFDEIQDGTSRECPLRLC